ncbi:hypothetical protein [Streptomyces sp. NPDC008150]|uniref:hypothetical protein n=1 Tax=Streptomyces sp. NPDC008150 TaxID=3364816 RepID=UPI0036EC9365
MTATATLTGNPRQAAAIGTQSARTLRPAPSVRPQVPWQGLFVEPVYTDGQPYQLEDDSDDTDD